MSTHPEDIDKQAEEFAERITRIAKMLGGDNVSEFHSDVISGAEPGESTGWHIEVTNGDGIALFTGGKKTFLVTAEWVCSTDGEGTWLRVESSKFRVFLEPLAQKPLFRYEFDMNVTSNLPRAHIHFHGEHPEMKDNPAFESVGASLQHPGSGSRRARRRQKKAQKPLLSAMHFPVGGPRFRPSLEDVLLMMIEEYGVEPLNGTSKEATELLQENILMWRKSQVSAVIRDMPSLAVEYLESRGYEIIPKPGSELTDSPEKLIIH